MIRLNYAAKSLLVIVSFFAVVPGFFCRKCFSALSFTAIGSYYYSRRLTLQCFFSNIFNFQITESNLIIVASSYPGVWFCFNDAVWHVQNLQHAFVLI